MKRLIITSICSMALLAGGLLTATPAWAQPQRVSGMRGQDRRESAADNRASISRPAASNNAGRRPSITTGGEGRQQRPMVSNGYTPVAGNRNREVHSSIDHGVSNGRSYGGDMRSRYPGFGNSNNRPGNYTNAGNRNREVHSGIDHGVNTDRSNGGDMRSRYPGFGNSNNRPNGRPGDNYGDHNRPGKRPGDNYGDHNRPGKRPGDNYGDHNRPGNNYGNHGHGYYDRYRYHHGYRPRDGRRDHMFVRYSHGWARPWRPAPRPWHHSMWWYRRPVIPVGFTPLSGCPIIDGIIGLYFGTAYDASLNFLYYNGYNIGGYYNNVIYLNDVDLYGYRWPGVMLNYDPVTGLNYAQFSYYTTYSDPYRYNRLYRSLCDAYGRPVQVVSGSYPQVTWLGGDGRGYVTLSQNFTNGRFFTAISFGY
ncbi:MAG: hypothetical protein PUF74_11220 [Sodaliphilus pleomorphus]|uniref:hypothetical protein n=1 Tax=Sodaliphilus pleomorphus TaxID=2606626 RepID=UPI002409DC4C|nr:hypothetical protein [Sodaliphilus pleomorphus]MDD6476072.1 hypothetical protein [Sodaliphilus pleomorphus]